MTLFEYTTRRQKLKSYFSEGLPLDSDEHLNGQYTLVSAGLSNFLPQIEHWKHKEIFTQALLHKKVSLLEQSCPEVLQIAKIEGYKYEIDRILKGQAAVICTFHTGSYRLINHVLAGKGIAYSLVVNHNVAKMDGGHFLEIFEQISGESGSIGIIDAEKPGAGLRMIRELRAGRSLLMYMDGNTGCGRLTSENPNLLLVDFLNQQIYARVGVGYLAQAVGVPVIGVVCQREDWSDIRIRFFDPIFPSKNMTRIGFAKWATQKLYNMVEPVISQYPEQWESWLYVHKFANIINQPPQPIRSLKCSKRVEYVLFNSERFGLYTIEGRPLLLEKSSYISYPIAKSLFSFLKGCQTTQVCSSQIQRSLYRTLINRDILLKMH